MSDLRVTADRLNLRDGIGVDSRVLVQLPAGTQVSKLAANPENTWFRVQTANGTIGWIAAKFAADVAAPAAPAAVVTLRVTTTGLNLRDGPGTDHPVLVQLPDGARVTRLDGSGDGQWAKVKTSKGTIGWVSTKFVTVDDGIDPDAPRPGDPVWYGIAWKERGVEEIAGPKSNPRVLEYQSATDDKHDDAVPWCSSFVNWCMRQAGQKRTGSAAARSWLSYGRKIDAPTRGCIVVFDRGGPPHGHVSFFVSRDGDFLRVLGGNQGDRVQISRYEAARVLGYRMPA